MDVGKLLNHIKSVSQLSLDLSLFLFHIIHIVVHGNNIILIIERKRERWWCNCKWYFRSFCCCFQYLMQYLDQAINSSCQKASCGNVSDIPFPFGIGAGFYHDPWFEVVCNYSYSWVSPKFVLKKLDLEVFNISLNSSYSGRGTVLVNYPTFSSCDNGSQISKRNMELKNSTFIFSKHENIFVAMGCHNFAITTSSDGLVFGSMTVCDTSTSKVITNNTRCNGINYCQATIASHFDAFKTIILQTKTVWAYRISL